MDSTKSKGLHSLGGVFFHVHLYLGKIPILTNIFQMDWNDQLVTVLKLIRYFPAGRL